MTERRRSAIALGACLSSIRSTCGALAVAIGALVAAATATIPAHAQTPRVGQPAPEIAGGPWINSPPLTLQELRGRVVLVEFWTYG